MRSIHSIQVARSLVGSSSVGGEMVGEGADEGAGGREREMRDLAANLRGASLGDSSAPPTVEMADVAASSRCAPRGMPTAGRTSGRAPRDRGVQDDADEVQRAEAAMNVVLQSAHALQRMPHGTAPNPRLTSYLVLPEGRALAAAVSDTRITCRALRLQLRRQG